MAEHPTEPAQQRRLMEAMLFASRVPLSPATLRERLGDTANLEALISDLRESYAGRGVELTEIGGGWTFRTASDLAPFLAFMAEVRRKLPRAAIEVLAIIAYHQPVTRAEIESIRGVQTGRGTLDILLETSWIRPGRRRETPGRPLTWITTPAFLEHFGLATLKDLPGIEEFRAAGLLDARPVLAHLSTPEDGEADGDDDFADLDDEPLLPLPEQEGERA